MYEHFSNDAEKTGTVQSLLSKAQRTRAGEEDRQLEPHCVLLVERHSGCAGNTALWLLRSPNLRTEYVQERYSRTHFRSAFPWSLRGGISRVQEQMEDEQSTVQPV